MKKRMKTPLENTLETPTRGCLFAPNEISINLKEVNILFGQLFR